MTFGGTAGDDILTGSGADDSFEQTEGGDDIVIGHGGDDIVSFGNAFTAGDFVNGGAGNDDIVVLQGDYSAGLTIGAHTIKDIEAFQLNPVGYNYVLTFKDNAVAAGHTMRIDAGFFTATDHLTLHAEAETNAGYLVTAGDGGDLIATGAGTGDDQIFARGGDDLADIGFGEDTVDMGEGDDTVQLTGTGAFDSGDTINGGDGMDTVVLNGDYSTVFTIGPSMMTNVEKLLLYPGNDYFLDLGQISAPANLFLVEGRSLSATDTLTANASSLAAYDHLALFGGPGNDVLTGGSLFDTLFGNGGADTLKGKAGADEFGYSFVSDSTGPNYDTIIGFDTHEDFLRTDAPGDIDAEITTGRLSSAHFDHQLAAAVHGRQLVAGDAVLFTPSQGTLAGETFLIVDRGGGAGYQAGLDLVIHLDGAKHIADFSTANFGEVI